MPKDQIKRKAKQDLEEFEESKKLKIEQQILTQEVNKEITELEEQQNKNNEKEYEEHGIDF